MGIRGSRRPITKAPLLPPEYAKGDHVKPRWYNGEDIFITLFPVIVICYPHFFEVIAFRQFLKTLLSSGETCPWLTTELKFLKQEDLLLSSFLVSLSYAYIQDICRASPILWNSLPQPVWLSPNHVCKKWLRPKKVSVESPLPPTCLSFTLPDFRQFLKTHLFKEVCPTST